MNNLDINGDVIKNFLDSFPYQLFIHQAPFFSCDFYFVPLIKLTIDKYHVQPLRSMSGCDIHRLSILILRVHGS